MPPPTLKLPGSVFAPLLLMTSVMAAPDPADSRSRLPADAARMYRFVTTPHPGELKWQEIPWLTDLLDAIRQARAESRPLVLFVSGDDPLEKC